MKNKKNKNVYSLLLVQLILQIISLILGFNFKSNSNSISSIMLGMITKVQGTNSFQNFIWAFTQNLTIMFLVFWVSYFSFGIIGTLWCINNSFMLGSLAKVYFDIIHSDVWLSILFMALELIAAIAVTFSSTYFRFEKYNFKKAFKNHINFDEFYMMEKKKREKNILYVFATVAAIILAAAILETIVLGSI